MMDIDIIDRYLSGERDFSQADLHGADLVGVVFADANLSSADLSEAESYDANLCNACLSSADLSYADFSGTDFINADLRQANLRHVNLSYADFSGANLSGADLSHADLSHADLIDANLTDTKLDLEIEEGLLLKIAKMILASPQKLEVNRDSWESDYGIKDSLYGWAVRLSPQGEQFKEKYGFQVAALKLLGVEAQSYFYRPEEQAITFLKSVVADQI